MAGRIVRIIALTFVVAILSVRQVLIEAKIIQISTGRAVYQEGSFG